MMRAMLCVLMIVALTGCKFLYPPLPGEAVPLAGMEEPLELFEEPDDESRRQELPAGVFTGVYVEEAGESLQELSEGAQGVKVIRLVENSPGVRAGLETGDLLLEVTVNDRVPPTELSWPSQWRELELSAVSGDVFHLVYERDGSERQAAITTIERFKPPERGGTERFREEERVGVVLRTATEVEARSAGLGPGAGAVVVGLSRGSPWRHVGVAFFDLIASVGGVPVDHPRVVLDAIQQAEPGTRLTLQIFREGQHVDIAAPVSQRAQEVRGFTIPLVFKHERDRGTSETSLLMGLLGHKSTKVAWEFRFLWLIRITGGDADRLEQVEEPKK